MHMYKKAAAFTCLLTILAINILAARPPFLYPALPFDSVSKSTVVSLLQEIQTTASNYWLSMGNMLGMGQRPAKGLQPKDSNPRLKQRDGCFCNKRALVTSLKKTGKKS